MMSEIDVDPVLQAELDKTTGNRIRRAAMDLLARREHGRRELILKLGRRFADYPERVEEEVDRLHAEGLQSDERLAEAFIRARFNRGQGPVKIRMELKAKGVADQIISRAFDESDVDWFELVQTVAMRKFRSLERTDSESGFKALEPKERARISRFLQQRGFTHDHIATLL